MTYSHRLTPLLATFALGIAACSPADDPAPQEQNAVASASGEMPAVPGTAPNAVATTGPAESPTTGGDGSPIVLTALTEQDFTDNPLDGELGCSFGPDASAPPLLVARGFADDGEGRAQGLAKIGDYPERLMNTAPGGYDAMIEGGRFGGRGMTFTVTLTGGAATTGGESPANPAELLLQRADGAERTIVGVWTCGP
jgi:hypothetical protein